MANQLFLRVLAFLSLWIYAIPRLPFEEPGLAGDFAVIWMLFSLLVLGGQLSVFMQWKNGRKTGVQPQKPQFEEKQTGSRSRGH